MWAAATAYWVKRSIRRASLRSMNCSATKSFTSPAIRESSCSALKRVIGPMPDFPANIASQFFSVPVPSGEIKPVPVMTTRRSATVSPLQPPDQPSLLVRVDVVDRIAHGLDVLCLLVGDLHLELFFHRHHQLHDVQAVRPQVLDEGRLGLDLVLAHAQLVGDDGLDLCLDVRRRHVSSLQKQHCPDQGPVTRGRGISHAATRSNFNAYMYIPPLTLSTSPVM